MALTENRLIVPRIRHVVADGTEEPPLVPGIRHVVADRGDDR
jgi:hypothetical protein